MWLILQAIIFSAVPAAFYIAGGEGMIFWEYTRYITARLYYQVYKTGSGVKYIRRRRRLSASELIKRYIFKLAGGCVFCFGFWAIFFQGLVGGHDVYSSFLMACVGITFLYFFVFKNG